MSAGRGPVARGDAGRRPRAQAVRRGRARIAALVAAVNVAAFSALVAEQATEWSSQWEAAALVWWVGGVTLVIGVVLVALIAIVLILIRSWAVRTIVAVALAAVQALVRAVVLMPAITAGDAERSSAAVWATGATGYATACATAFLVAALIEREDRERSRRQGEEAKARAAIDDLEREELRVRREVADRLHGAVQFRLAAVAAGLDQAADRMPPDAADWAPRLRDWAFDLDELREEHVRSLSHTLFPSGADLGAYEAIRALLDRLPTTISSSVVLGQGMKELLHRHRSPLPLLDRLVCVYTVEEAATNALKHGGADRLTVRIDAKQSGDR